MITVTINGQDLIARTDSSPIPLSSADIFAATFKGEPIGGEAVRSWPTGLQFSRYPANPHIELPEGKGAVIPQLSFRTRSNKRIPVSQMPLMDHVILDGTWYPIFADDFAAAQEILGCKPGASPTPIQLPDFVRMSRHPRAKELLGDSLAPGSQIIERLLKESAATLPTGLAPDVVLRPYQLTGWRWLNQMASMGLGGVLADEMGLGKTLQIISLLASRMGGEHPSLLVVPASLIPNWRRELLRFCPALSWMVHTGANRSTSRKDFSGFDIIITTYDLLALDCSLFITQPWSTLICDEAHYFRNPDTQRFKALQLIRLRSPDAPAIAITGTPIQNSLRDAWALFEYAVPGYCGPKESFSDHYADDVTGALALEPMLTPFMLRRKVLDVANDLPPLIQIPQALELSDSEAVGYEDLRSELVDSPGGMLAAMTPLRMYCCHPRLRFPDWNNVELAQSVKFSRLIEILADIRRRGEKCLIFTSYNEMARLISHYFSSNMGFWTDVINGEVPAEARQDKIDTFTSHNGPAILVLNPQAAGVGLNIQAANHVIHYNLEWNPGVEEQATDRAYRRGQTRPVTVHRLFYLNTVEEVIHARVEKKRQLITHAVRGLTGEDASDLALALKLSPAGKQASANRYQRS